MVGKQTLTFALFLAQLPVVNKASKHLCVHEELQELPDAPRRVGLTEALPLQFPGAATGGAGLAHVEGVVPHQFHEEAHKGFRHERAQIASLACRGTDGQGRPSRSLLITLLTH